MRSQSETEIKEFPAPAKQLTNWKGVEGVFLGAALLCFLFLIYSVLQENNPDSWSIRLLGINASASLFSAFLSLFFLRRQFMHSVAPLLAYRNTVTTKSDTGFSCGEADARFYVVSLTNVGRGIGIVTGARYWVELAGEGTGRYPLRSWTGSGNVPIATDRAHDTAIPTRKCSRYSSRAPSSTKSISTRYISANGAPLRPMRNAPFSRSVLRRPRRSSLWTSKSHTRVSSATGIAAKFM